MTDNHATAAIRAMGLDAFLATYSIGAVRAGGLISLKYNQIESPMFEPCVADCRGLVVREDDPTRIVAMAYRKFWNLGEKYADAIDWPTARIMEKLDGSLMTLYAHEGRWCVAACLVEERVCEHCASCGGSRRARADACSTAVCGAGPSAPPVARPADQRAVVRPVIVAFAARVSGADADIVLWDPTRKVTISQSLMHHGADYTPWEGYEVTGWPVRVSMMLSAVEPSALSAWTR